MQLKKFNHIQGVTKQIFKLDGRQHWMITNDEHWANTPDTEQNFPVFPEGFFALKHDDLQPLPENNLLVFSEVYEVLVQKKLEAAALEDVVRDLKAMYAEHDMERLIAALEHYRHYDDLIK